MKRFEITVFFGALIIFFSGCKEDSMIIKSIEGEWELVRVTGSRPVITYPAGNGNVLQFSASNYQLFENRQPVKSGTYTMVEDASAQTSVCLVLGAGEYRNRIIYDNDYNSPKKFIQISNDTLSILSGCFAVDAGSNLEYVRRR
jgi:hypothetical protein